MNYYKKALSQEILFYNESELIPNKIYIVVHPTEGWFFSKYLGMVAGDHLWSPGWYHLNNLESAVNKTPSAHNTNQMKALDFDVDGLVKANWVISFDGNVTIKSEKPKPLPKKKIPARILNES